MNQYIKNFFRCNENDKPMQFYLVCQKSTNEEIESLINGGMMSSLILSYGLLACYHVKDKNKAEILKKYITKNKKNIVWNSILNVLLEKEDFNEIQDLNNKYGIIEKIFNHNDLFNNIKENKIYKAVCLNKKLKHIQSLFENQTVGKFDNLLLISDLLIDNSNIHYDWISKIFKMAIKNGKTDIINKLINSKFNDKIINDLDLIIFLHTKEDGFNYFFIYSQEQINKMKENTAKLFSTIKLKNDLMEKLDNNEEMKRNEKKDNKNKI